MSPSTYYDGMWLPRHHHLPIVTSQWVFTLIHCDITMGIYFDLIVMSQWLFNLISSLWYHAHFMNGTVIWNILLATLDFLMHVS